MYITGGGKPRPYKRAFTLLELLVAASLLSITAITALSLFSKGVDIWEDARFTGSARYNAVLFLEDAAKQIENCVNFEGIPFSGENQSVSLPVIVKDYNQETQVIQDSIGCIKYVFDNSKKVVYKYEAVYPDCRQAVLFNKIRILELVESLSFEYAAEDDEGNLNWLGSWKEEQGIPEGVRIKVTIALEETEKTYEFEKLVYIPAA